MLRSLAICLLLACLVSPANAATYEVGEGLSLNSLGEVPWEALAAGDVVRVHYRAQPYREKLVLAVLGSEAAPIRIVGVPGPLGQRPVISGEDATTRRELNYWGEPRGILKIGGANTPSSALGAWLVIEGLEIRGARNRFTDSLGAVQSYADNAAAIFIERGENIVVRDCALYDSGNGLFVANESRNIRVERSEIAGNGNSGSILEHNVYSEALGIVFEGNWLRPLCAGCLGNNLKDRSAGTVIRYNWIEGGNRQLDLVDSGSAALRSDLRYAETHVYGNVMIEADDEGNRQIVHWGGDSGNATSYRAGTLFFYGNTVVSQRRERTTLLRNSSPSGEAHVYGNIVQAGEGIGQLEILGDALGRAVLRSNWLTMGFTASFAGGAQLDADGSNLSGGDPGFSDALAGDYSLAPTSPCVDTGAVPMVAPSYAVNAQAPEPLELEGRPSDGRPDIGALERGAPLPWDGGASPSTPDGGTSGGGGGGAVLPPGSDTEYPVEGVEDDSGCACSTRGQRTGGSGLGALCGLTLLMWRQRRVRALARGTPGSTKPSRHRAA